MRRYGAKAILHWQFRTVASAFDLSQLLVVACRFGACSLTAVSEVSMFISPWLAAGARAAFIVAIAAPAAAQQALSLQDAQRLALSRSQQLVSKDAASSAVREMGVAASQLPDPVLKLGINNVPVNGADRFSLSRDFMTMRSIGVMQEITRSDKRRLRVERLERDGMRIEAERLAVASEVQRSAAMAWIDRYYAQAAADLIRRQLQQAEVEVQGAEIAYRNARGSQADFFGSRSALVNLQDKLRQADRQVESAILGLARWVGTSEARRPLAGQVPWRELSTADFLDNGQYHALPQLAALAAQVDAAESEVRLAQANTRSDWSVEAMYSQRGSAYSDMVSIGLSIPLQVNQGRRQDREVAAKLAALKQARADHEEALRSSESELRVLLNEWTTNKERVTRLKQDLMPAARMRSQAALTAYQAGKAELTAVLAARREEVEAASQVLNLEMETARLWAQLNYLFPEAAAVSATKERP
jgi:outer membrane protein TolC